MNLNLRKVIFVALGILTTVPVVARIVERREQRPADQTTEELTPHEAGALAERQAQYGV